MLEPNGPQSAADIDTIVRNPDELGVMNDFDNQQGFKVVSHRKKRSSGVPAFITAISSDVTVQELNPIVFSNAIKSVIGAPPSKHRVTG